MPNAAIQYSTFNRSQGETPAPYLINAYPFAVPVTNVKVTKPFDSQGKPPFLL